MKINVGVFFGGSSVEHEVAVISAIQAIHSLDQSKYTPIPIYITKKGEIYTGDALLDINNYKNIESLLGRSTKVTIGRTGNEFIVYRTPAKMLGSNVLAKIDIAFPIVHGTKCEDGTVQGFLELLGIPYVGCDVLSSALGMEKVAQKQILKENGLPVLDCISFYNKEWSVSSESLIQNIESSMGYPVIVKPSNLGSSVGIKKVNNRAELEEAVSLAGSFANKILVERAITNLREINCSVLGDYEKAEASACEEPIAHDEILSYSDKYLGESSKGSGSKGMSSLRRKLPAEISPEQEKEIKELALKTFQALGCSGVARIDFLMDVDDGNKVYVNEINTIPGSLAFYLWEATGLLYKYLLDRMIEIGFKRDRERQGLMFSYDTNIFALGGTPGLKGKK